MRLRFIGVAGVPSGVFSTGTTRLETEMTERSEDRKQFLFDVFVTACEGGIQYWSKLSTYHVWKDEKYGTVGHVDDLDGFYAIVHEITDDGDAHEDEGVRVDAAVIAKGIGLFNKCCLGKIDSQGNPTSDGKQIPADHYWRQFLEADRTNGEHGDYDAEVADNIVQFGLFGKAIYG